MAGLKIEMLDEGSFGSWDGYVEGHGQGTVFQSTRWLKNISDKVVVMVAVDGQGVIRGGLASVKTRRFGVTGFHMPPFSPYSGPLVSPSQKQRFAAARSEVQKTLSLILANLPPGGHVDFILPPGDCELFPYVQAGFSPSLRLTHELHPDQDFSQRAARQTVVYLRKLTQQMQEGGVEVRLDGEIGPAVELWRETVRRRGFRCDFELLEELLRFGEEKTRWRSVVAFDRDGRPLAACLALTDWRRAYNLVSCSSGTLPKGLERVSLLSFQSIVKACHETGLIYDFEGSLLPGVESFYRLFGGQPKNLVRMERSGNLVMAGLRGGRQMLREFKGGSSSDR